MAIKAASKVMDKKRLRSQKTLKNRWQRKLQNIEFNKTDLIYFKGQ